MFCVIPLELKNSQPDRTVPWVNYALLAANLIVYLLTLFLGIYWTVGPGTGLASLVLYGFSHAGFWHFALNMCALWVFGNPVNCRLGNGYYLLAYLGTILLIGIFARLLLPAQLLGASGGVFAVMIIAFMLLPSAQLVVAYLAVFPLTIILGLLNPPKYGIHWLVRWGELTVPALWCLLFVPLLELWAFVWSGWGLTPRTLGNVNREVFYPNGVSSMAAQLTEPLRGTLNR